MKIGGYYRFVSRGEYPQIECYDNCVVKVDECDAEKEDKYTCRIVSMIEGCYNNTWFVSEKFAIENFTFLSEEEVLMARLSGEIGE